MAKHRPDLYSNTISTIRNGATEADISRALHKCVKAAHETGKVATLTVKMTIKPDNAHSKTMFIDASHTAKVPAREKGVSIMYCTEEGNLQRNDPDQRELPLRSVDSQEEKPLRNIGEK